jgi:type IV pilus assembly protein PilE
MIGATGEQMTNLRTPAATRFVPHTPDGFTLIEAMITVAVISILSAIAFPSYQDYIVRGKVVEAQTSLSDFQVRMEQFFQDNRLYALTATPTVCGVPMPKTKYFSYSCVPVAAPGFGYTITATNVDQVGLGPVGSYIYTTSETNLHQTLAFKGVTITPIANCWLGKRGDTC